LDKSEWKEVKSEAIWIEVKGREVKSEAIWIEVNGTK
jgi:hypothetical protein